MDHTDTGDLAVDRSPIEALKDQYAALAYRVGLLCVDMETLLDTSRKECNCECLSDEDIAARVLRAVEYADLRIRSDASRELLTLLREDLSR